MSTRAVSRMRSRSPRGPRSHRNAHYVTFRWQVNDGTHILSGMSHRNVTWCNVAQGISSNTSDVGL